MDVWLQSIVNGLFMGGIYALVAIGLTMIFGVLKLINFAHGEFMMLGMFITYFLVAEAGWNPYLTIPVVFVVLFVLGAIVQKLLISRIQGDTVLNSILLTAGLSLFILNGMMVLFTPDNRRYRFDWSFSFFEAGDVVINVPRFIAFLGGIILCLALYLFMQYTKTGKSIRAAAQDKQGALLSGINVKSTYMIAFGLGVALAGIAGSLISTYYFINPQSGQPFALVTFVVVVLGTMGNFLGALIGGLIIGVVENLSVMFWSPSLRQVASYSIFILILLFKPRGLFGGKANE